PIGVAAYSILCKLLSTCWKRARNRSVLKRAVKRQPRVPGRFRLASSLRSVDSACPLVTSYLTVEVQSLSSSGQFPRAPPAADKSRLVLEARANTIVEVSLRIRTPVES